MLDASIDQLTEEVLADHFTRSAREWDKYTRFDGMSQSEVWEEKASAYESITGDEPTHQRTLYEVTTVNDGHVQSSYYEDEGTVQRICEALDESHDEAFYREVSAGDI